MTENIKRYFKNTDGLDEIKPVKTHIPSTVKISICNKPHIPFSETKSLIEKRDGYCLRTFISHSDDLSEAVEECSIDEIATHGLLLVEITPKNSGLVYVPLTAVSMGSIDRLPFYHFDDVEQWRSLLKRPLEKYLEKEGHVRHSQRKELREFVNNAKASDFSLDTLLLPPVYEGYGIEAEIYRPNNFLIEGISATSFNNAATVSRKPAKRMLDYLVHSLIENGIKNDGERSVASALHSLNNTTSPAERSKNRLAPNRPDAYLLQQISRIKKAL